MSMPAPDVSYDPDFAPAAALISDPTRAAILRALLPDRPLAAGELARMAGVSAATASFHLAKLLDGMLRRGLLQEQSSGRTDRSDTSARRFEVTGPERGPWVRSA